MSHFFKSGNTIRVSNSGALDVREQLPPKNYVVRWDERREEFYLEQISPFEINCKLYGDITKNTERIFKTFEDRSGSTGVILTGEKGSGKTLLSKSICILASGSAIPTIVVNSPWKGDVFYSFLQSIEQPCIILFDEFEKVYKKEEEQEAILTLLDGVFPSRKLFLLTCNNIYNVNSNMKNRPSRLYYYIPFNGLSSSSIKEYCEDVLINKNHIESLCRISTIFDQFNFDMLQAVVEEMNRYNESPEEVLKLLNVKPEFGSNCRYSVSLEINGKEVPKMLIRTDEWIGVPLSAEMIHISVLPDPNDEKDEWKDLYFRSANMISYDSNTGKYIFVNKNKEKLTLVKIKDRVFNYSSVL